MKAKTGMGDVRSKTVALIVTALAVQWPVFAQSELPANNFFNYVPDASKLVLIPPSDDFEMFAGRKKTLVRKSARPRSITLAAPDGRYTSTLGKEVFEGEMFIDRERHCSRGKWPDGSWDRGSCVHVFRYGDCIMTFPEGITRNLRGMPVRPAEWRSVSKMVGEDFEWPDEPATDVQMFTCHARNS